MAKAIYGAGTDLAEQWAKDRHAELDTGRLGALVAALLERPLCDHLPGRVGHARLVRL